MNNEPIVQDTLKRLSGAAPEWPAYNWETVEVTAPYGSRNRALLVTTNAGDDRGPLQMFIPFSIDPVMDDDGQLCAEAHCLIVDAHSDAVAAA